MSLRKQLEYYFENGVYPYVKKTVTQNISKLLQDATDYDNLPNDISDDVKTEMLNDIHNRLLIIKIANDKFSNIFNGLNP